MNHAFLYSKPVRAVLMSLLLAGCQLLPQSPATTAESQSEAPESVTTAEPPAECVAAKTEQQEIEYLTGQVALRTATLRITELEARVKRLRYDLDLAEGTLVSAESGLQAGLGRADAIARLAETQILYRHVADLSPKRQDLLEEAKTKLEQADRHFGEFNFGAAVYFAQRGKHILNSIKEEVERLSSADNAYVVSVDTVNLRTAPSTNDAILLTLERDTPIFGEESSGEWLLVRTADGRLGWVRGDLVRSVP
ncbi:MAG: SH3 domain-containing protein [Gammaproteobacteria bacterium]|nr:SH3 domain-containing protein [Gammaproteobacteria bacterium]MDH3467564.1 SH3 domain-containing protein [Gammaproteobacteria bacterium]